MKLSQNSKKAYLMNNTIHDLDIQNQAVETIISQLPQIIILL